MSAEFRVASAAIAAGGALLMTTAASGAFVGIGVTAEHVTIETESFGDATAYSVYALVDNPLDTVRMVFGDGIHDLVISTTGTYFQHPFGNVNEPQAAVLPLYPELAYDSYVTIGATSQDAAGPGTFYNAILAGLFGESALEVLDGGAWYVLPEHPGTPEVPIQVPGLGLGVLIGHFTTQAGERIDGVVNIFGELATGGDWVAYDVRFSAPAPAALPLLGLAALTTRRRRRPAT